MEQQADGWEIMGDSKRGRARMVGGTQGCSGEGIRVQKLARKCSRSCWWGTER